MPQKSTKGRSRIYWREQGGERRAYADFRDFGDVGGRREALVAGGTKTATTDPLVAEKLASERLVELQNRRRNKVILGLEQQATLAAFAAHHLVEKQRSGRFTIQWLEAVQMHLEAAIEFFCNGGRPLPRDCWTRRPILSGVAPRELGTISVADVQKFATWLAQRGNGRQGRLSASSQRKYLNSLSNLFRRAASEGCVHPGYNPVQSMIDKPRDPSIRRESRWLEVPEAAQFLSECLRYSPPRAELGISREQLHAVVATMLLTGGRPSEVLGLEVTDVNFMRRVLVFRPNSWRRLKTATSHRAVPLWPQLEEVLRSWLTMRPPSATDLLFPSSRSDGMIRDLRKALDNVRRSCTISAGAIRPYAFRHTYCAARLQTLDHGQPISPWTVAREMGHGGRALVDRVYGHLGEIRHRSEVVEYRVEQSADSCDASAPDVQAA
jgi:integrase